MLIHDAVSAAVAVWHALLGWLIVTGVVAGIAGTAAVACIAPGVKAARRGLRARVSHEQPASDSSPATTPQRRTEPRPRAVPSWAHTDHHRYEEAA